MKKLTLLFLSFLIVGCGSRSAVYERHPQALRQRAAIIFVPGFYGTALADRETGERHFLSAWKSLFGSVPLAMVEPDLGVEGARPLRPDGVLESIPIVPGLYGVNVYGEALDFLRDTYGARAEIVPFAYDWRDDLLKTAGQLDRLVNELSREGAGPLFLVGHSMGGLLSALYLRRYPQSPIKAAVIAAAPLRGVATAFRNLQTGTSLGPAKTPLNQISVSTFPSMYYLIPHPDTQAYRDRRFRPMNEAIYDVALWERWHWALFRPKLPNGSPYRAKRREASAHYLRTASEAAALLRSPASGPKKPLLVYIGTGESTFARVRWTGDSLHSDGHWLFHDSEERAVADEESLFADGDGTVPTLSAEPPENFLSAFESKVQRSPVGHASMFSDDNVLTAIRAFLRGRI